MNEKMRFEAPEKPEIEDFFEITPDTKEFENPEKAEAIIKNLGLSIGDTIKENGDEYEINPKEVLSGHSPKDYENAINNLKNILTPLEIDKITKAIKRRTKDYDKELYDEIKNRFDNFFKNFEPKKNLKKELIGYLNYDKELDMGGIYNIVYHLLSKDKSDYIKCYKLAWKNKPVPNIQTWIHNNDGVYNVLTDDEADYKADEYLTDDPELWRMAVEGGHTEQSLEDWAKWVLDCDGRGSILASYDSVEESQEIDGTDYYIYRTN